MLIAVGGVVLLAGAYVFVRLPWKFSEKATSNASVFNRVSDFNTSFGKTDAEKVGKSLSNGTCVGKDKRKLTTLPMRMEDFSMIIPYGLVVGDHVTPIDHQYFSPTVFHSPRVIRMKYARWRIAYWWRFSLA